MSALLQAIIGALGAGVGQKIGAGLANVTALAALAPLALWLLENKEEAFITLTYGELAFFGGLLTLVVKLVHYTRPGGQYHNPGNWVDRG